MKKIPTMFVREFSGHRITGIRPEFTNETCKEALERGTATVKIDGACCAVINGVFYKRIDLGKAKSTPDTLKLILCEDKPDPVTGHWPAWIRCSREDSADKWFFSALDYYCKFAPYNIPPDGTYEAIGKHFNGNPYFMNHDTLHRHGSLEVDVARTFDGVRWWLKMSIHEGLVFWLDGKPVCKIKRSDFGYHWPMKEEWGQRVDPWSSE